MNGTKQLYMCLSLNNEKKERKVSKFSLLLGIMMERIQGGNSNQAN